MPCDSEDATVQDVSDSDSDSNTVTCVLHVAGFSSAGQPSVGVFSENVRSNWTCFHYIWFFVLIVAS